MDKQQEELVINNIPLARWIAGQYFGGGNEEEMISAAYPGLCIAALTYNKDFGTKFATYASKVIRNEIGQELRRIIKKRDFEFAYHEQTLKESDLYLEDIVAEKRSCFEDLEEEWTCSMIYDSPNLYEKEKQVIIWLVLQGRRQIDIAAELGVTQAQVSRLRNKGLKKLKADYLMNYA